MVNLNLTILSKEIPHSEHREESLIQRKALTEAANEKRVIVFSIANQ
jgi:hypothetical protein